MELHLADLTTGYAEVLAAVLQGPRVRVRDLWTHELTNATLVFPRADATMLPVGVDRAVNTRLAAVEALQVVAEASTPWLVLQAAPQFREVLVDGSTESMEYGAYGPRVAGQLGEVVQLLADDPSTRQALVTIWRPTDLTHSGDKPCTVFLQFLVRDGRLELHATMRSNDAWRGLAYDAFVFTQVQLSVAGVLGLPVGRYVHHATSLHVYDTDLAAVQRVSIAEPVELPTQFPAGVRGRWHDAGRPPNRWEMVRRSAQYLLAGNASADEKSDNEWYASQLEKITKAAP